MTGLDNSDDLDPLDAVVSAVLDDEASADDRARFATHPAASERHSSFGDLQQRVRDVPLPPEGALRQMLASIYVSLDAPISDNENRVSVAKVEPLTRGRSSRRMRWRGGLIGGAVAASILIGVIALTRQSDSSRNVQVALDWRSTPAFGNEAAERAGAKSASSAADAASTSTTGLRTSAVSAFQSAEQALTDVVQRGSHPLLSAGATIAESQQPTSGSSTTALSRFDATTGSSAAVPSPQQNNCEGTFVESVLVNGTAVLIVERNSSLVAVDAATCAVLASRAIQQVTPAGSTGSPRADAGASKGAG